MGSADWHGLESTCNGMTSPPRGSSHPLLPCCRSAWPTTTCMCFARASPPSMRTWRSAGVLLLWLRWGDMFTVVFGLCWRCARGCERGQWELLPLVCMWFSRQALLLGS